MKDFIIGLVVTMLLVAIFSVGCFPDDVFPPLGDIGTEYPGDSGIVLPGDGSDMAEVDFVTDNNVADKKKPTADKTEEVQEASEETQETSEEIKEEHNMDGILLSYWHGVATVLIGETVALMVAVAWMKIKGGK